MTAGILSDLELLCCPGCGADLEPHGDGLRCAGCAHVFPCEDGIPQLFWPTEPPEGKRDITELVKDFYEETPFPNYEAFDSTASLAAKAREGIFARLLDEQVPPGARVLECGTGTGQLSAFLSIANRDVFGTDVCMNSLKLGADFARKHSLSRVRYLQMNLFRPAFKPETFDLVISNGVLHHTADPLGGFETISRLARPGGYVLVGLYHRYGRLITDLRRVIFRASGGRFKWLDPNLRGEAERLEREQAWFADQYQHPHESKHTLAEVIDTWLPAAGLRFVKSIPRTRLFRPITPEDRLFAREEPGAALERLLVELGMIRSGSREGGFFIVIAQRT